MYYVVLPSRTAVAIRGAACQRQGPCAPWLCLVGATLAVLVLRLAVLATSSRCDRDQVGSQRQVRRALSESTRVARALPLPGSENRARLVSFRESCTPSAQ